MVCIRHSPSLQRAHKSDEGDSRVHRAGIYRKPHRAMHRKERVASAVLWWKNVCFLLGFWWFIMKPYYYLQGPLGSSVFGFPSHPGHRQGVEFPVLHSRSSSVLCFTHCVKSVHVSLNLPVHPPTPIPSLVPFPFLSNLTVSFIISSNRIFLTYS